MYVTGAAAAFHYTPQRHARLATWGSADVPRVSPRYFNARFEEYDMGFYLDFHLSRCPSSPSIIQPLGRKNDCQLEGRGARAYSLPRQPFRHAGGRRSWSRAGWEGWLPLPLPAAGPLLSICRSITMEGLYGPFCPGGTKGRVARKYLVRSLGCPSHRKTIRNDDFLFTQRTGGASELQIT